MNASVSTEPKEGKEFILLRDKPFSSISCYSLWRGSYVHLRLKEVKLESLCEDEVTVTVSRNGFVDVDACFSNYFCICWCGEDFI